MPPVAAAKWVWRVLLHSAVCRPQDDVQLQLAGCNNFTSTVVCDSNQVADTK